MTVEIVAHKGESLGLITVFLINRSTNLPPNPLRYVLPLGNISLRINSPGIQPTEVLAVTGTLVEHEMVDGTLNLSLPKLNEYECTVIRS